MERLNPDGCVRRASEHQDGHEGDDADAHEQQQCTDSMTAPARGGSVAVGHMVRVADR
jgi:hypothetical protein